MMILALLSLTHSEPELPKWPQQYHLRGTWRIPYWQIRVPYVVDTIEGKAQSERSYDLEHIIKVYENRTYTIQTSPDGISCTFSNVNIQKPHELTAYLPKNSDTEKWVYNGESVVLGFPAESWKLSNVEGVEQWYRIFYIRKDTRVPLRFYMHGKSIRGSHPAEYYFDIEEYSPFANVTNFLPPVSGCLNIATGGPNVEVFAKDISVPRIATNAEHEFQCDDFNPSKDIKYPEEFSWRAVPGVVPTPRDQANCGSCWAQSASSAMSSQFSLHKRGNVTVSIQQIQDCVWTNESKACAGGEGYDAFGYLAKNQIPITTEDEYPYLGVSGKCQPTINNPLGYVKGCKKIVQDADDKYSALKRAVYKYGPLMIYMKAGTAPFVTYTSGIFDDPICKGIVEHDQTDHGVLLTGWKVFNIGGVKKVGLEIMNSWSDMWGEKGFAYIAEGDNDCGVPVYPLLPEVELYFPSK